MRMTEAWARCDDIFGPAVSQRLFTKIVPQESGCWHWQGSRSGATRRPTIYINGETLYVARVMLRIKLRRAIRRGLLAAHHCDTDICVQPDCVHEATHGRNLRDAWARGRRIKFKRPTTLTE